MQMNPLSSASLEIGAAVNASYSSLIAASDQVRHYATEQVEEWEVATKAFLRAAFPLACDEKKLIDWKFRLQSHHVPENAPCNAADDFIAFCKKVKRPANESFWRSQFAINAPGTTIARKLAGDKSIGISLLLAEWQKQMDQARLQWELREIELRRAALMQRLDETLRLFQELHAQLCSLGLDTGILLDLCRGNLTAQDIRQLERWAKYLADDPGIRALCDLLGKMRQIELSERVERVRSVMPVEVALPDINSREEISGIRFGTRIEHALPSELALLTDPDTSLLFDLKYVESSLMCFDMQGIQSGQSFVETEEELLAKEAEKQGPMIICIDSSGSMNGMPETVAKAVALYLAAKAKEQRRPCYLINFSTGIDTLDLSADVGMEALMRFLQMSFHGGTDVTPALDHALDTMEQDAYENADLLIVSDFIMSGLQPCLHTRIERQRLAGNRFHSLVVGACYMTRRLKILFDHEWVFDPGSSRIHDLVNFERTMLGPA